MVKLGTWGFESRLPQEGETTTARDGKDCRICAAAGDLLCKLAGGGKQFMGGGFSHESEHDLAVMVSDFLENGSGGGDSRCSSDSESSYSDLAHLTENILYHKHTVDQYESDLLSAVHSLVLSINDKDLHIVRPGPCNGSCIRFYLVKLLRSSGYDAAVCTSKWQNSGKVPGGDYEYIDVANHSDTASSERLIIDIDFRSHFEIARPSESYDAIMNSLPVIYVGTLSNLKHFLHIMVEAAKSSLRQNSMPLPPWRSFAYLQCKWYSPYQRNITPEEVTQEISSDHEQCIGHLRRLKSNLKSEIAAERLLKPINIDNTSRKVKQDRRRHSSLRTL